MLVDTGAVSFTATALASGALGEMLLAFVVPVLFRGVLALPPMVPFVKIWDGGGDGQAQHCCDGDDGDWVCNRRNAGLILLSILLPPSWLNAGSEERGRFCCDDQVAVRHTTATSKSDNTESCMTGIASLLHDDCCSGAARSVGCLLRSACSTALMAIVPFDMVSNRASALLSSGGQSASRTTDDAIMLFVRVVGVCCRYSQVAHRHTGVGSHEPASQRPFDCSYCIYSSVE